MLHRANMLCRKLLTESELSKDISHVSLNGHKLVYHGYLLSIESQFPLIDLDTSPELLHFLSDARADFCDAVHLLQRCPHVVTVKFVQLVDAHFVWV